MAYDLEFLKNFDGNMLPSQINMSELIYAIEKHVSQFRYFYHSDNPKYSDLIIEFSNFNIPHLLGLSRYHHKTLPTYQAREIINNLKNGWDLDYLKKGDEQWFAENQDKLIGVLLLYQLLRVQNCKVLTPLNIINTSFGKRFKRDNVYFVILKSTNDREYTVELAPMENSPQKFIPKSLKINDTHLQKCSEVSLTFLKAERIKYDKKRKKGRK
ncbi:hypothetical protein [Lactococcus lactis]|uniref:hypothetical protein n=1 Tax=Lactococcus lactis TaxID=1358 RepID=UPI00288E8C59|nr:hypothetical protein [Lactococcus lactis]MDT2909205.1 hypothetical protein [Lactococcus lactis]MDT2925265.1 hypothetical protein [Lactococcus lactis]MDT2952876.1 hypothetical protein [Lactococcus lactis]